MLKLNASYSKKVPVPDREFSSQNYHCSMECEIADGLSGAEIQTRIHEVFDLVRQSVESEIGGQVSRHREPEKETTTSEENRKADHEKASTKQIKFITDLAGRKGMPLKELDSEIERQFHVNGLYDLTRHQASKLVDKLKAA